MTRREMLVDPRTRMALGAAGMAGTAAIVRRDRVGRRETQVFRLVNGLPDPLFAPAWVVMQLGTLAAAPVTAAVALAAGERVLARRLLVGGTAGWARCSRSRGTASRGGCDRTTSSTWPR